MKFFIIFCLLSPFLWGEDNKEVGLKLTLLSENEVIAAGQPFVVGLRIEHEAGYHTYWKNPGVVGLATKLVWQLPEGFTASKISWPYPELCDMAGHPCHGYQRDVTLLTTITPPVEISTDEVTLRATATWMCCARTCHPGSKPLTLNLAVTEVAQKDSNYPFKQARREIPQASESWSLSSLTAPSPEILKLAFSTKTGEKPSYFFSSDGQISSDQEQVFHRGASSGQWILTIARSEFAPEGRVNFAGVLRTSSDHHFLTTKK